jgi:hypothetical protein
MRIFTLKQSQAQKRACFNPIQAQTAASLPHDFESSILHRTIENQAAQPIRQTNAEELETGLTDTPLSQFQHDFSRIPLHAPAPVTIQTKKAINQPGDQYEQEADRISETVMRMPAPQQQDDCGLECPKGQRQQSGQVQKYLQTRRTRAGAPGQIAVPPIVHEVLRSPGQALDPATRTFMEPRFGHDFAKVQIHTNNRAAKSAEAVNALAYTVGDHIVFGAGQHTPGSFHGQELLAHELAHVVQQNGGQALQSNFAGQHNISPAPTTLMSRLGPLSDAEEQKKEEAQRREEQEAQKNVDARNEAVKRHIEQQQRVIDLLDKARNLQPDPKKGLRDPDNLFRNTVGLLDGKKLTLTILSPTHYSSTLHFDSRVKHPKIGGDYPADPRLHDTGMVFDDTSAFGKLQPPSTPVTFTISTLPPKVERAPGEVPPAPARVPPAPAKTVTSPPMLPFSPGDIHLFTRGLTITEAGLRNTFVHEAQHVADLNLQRPRTNSIDDKLADYKTEFRAFWIQPPVPPSGGLAPAAIDSLPEPTAKPDNSRQVIISQPQNCTVCPAPAASAKGAFAEPGTAMKNARQEQIFWHIMSNYKAQQYDCCYVFNEKFHKEVNRFAYPESVNLINSDRLMNLNLELQKLNQSMTLAQVSSTSFVALLTRLEPLDWIFLEDMKLSKPFWDALQMSTPKFVYKGVQALVKKGMKAPVSEAEVNKVLSAK